jgi:predicted Rossmann-fold nucleotide-binding protein
MALKIGVMGGATGVISRAHLNKAHQLGRAIATSGCVLITGACPGLPLAAACGAKQAGGTVVGISPGLSLDEHVYKYDSPTEFHDVLIFTGSGLMGREVVNSAAPTSWSSSAGGAVRSASWPSPTTRGS